MKNYFLVTRPLQYFNVTNINSEGSRVLVMMNNFADSEFFFNNVKDLSWWDEAYFFTSFKETYKFLGKLVTKQDQVYLDSDYGLLKYYWITKIKTRNIFIYEEGTGSYRNDLLTLRGHSKINYNILKLLGIKEHFGGIKKVKGLFIYDIPKHKNNIVGFKNERLSFNRSFIEHFQFIKPHFDFQIEQFTDIINDCKGKKVALYLSSWKYDENVSSLIDQGNYDISILKLHPNIKEINTNNNYIHILRNGIFVEIFIIMLLEKACELTIYSESSSALMYIEAKHLKKINL